MWRYVLCVGTPDYITAVLALLITLQQYSPWRSGAASQSSRSQVSHTPVSAWNKWSSHECSEPCLALPCLALRSHLYLHHAIAWPHQPAQFPAHQLHAAGTGTTERTKPSTLRAYKVPKLLNRKIGKARIKWNSGAFGPLRVFLP